MGRTSRCEVIQHYAAQRLVELHEYPGESSRIASQCPVFVLARFEKLKRCGPCWKGESRKVRIPHYYRVAYDADQKTGGRHSPAKRRSPGKKARSPAKDDSFLLRPNIKNFWIFLGARDEANKVAGHCWRKIAISLIDRSQAWSKRFSQSM